MNPVLWTLVQDPAIEAALREAAEAGGVEIRAFANVADALSPPEPEGGVILAIEATSKLKNYLTVVRRVRRTFFFLDCVGFGPAKDADAIERERALGVDRYVPVPVNPEELAVVFAETVSLRRMKSAARIVGRSPAVNEMLQTVLQVAPTEVPVLIEGESGSGKELTARAIHLASRRAERLFEAINCGAFAEGVLESELFGHERGSFTGAVSRREGVFERARGGTLFLDEVGEMSLNMQVKLLRVIETGEFMRVGGSQRLHADVRIVAATNRELESAVERGEFRKDLYYRLKVVRIRIPPLRARTEDIPVLAHYFIAQAARRHGKRVRTVEPQGMDLLAGYAWPGNVRELANVVDNLIILSREGTIGAAEIENRLRERAATAPFPDLPVHVRKSRDEIEREIVLSSLLSLHNDVREILRLVRGEAPAAPPRWRGYVEVAEEEPRNLEKMERDAIREALAANAGNRRKAARQLGISERTLYRRIREYGLGAGGPDPGSDSGR
jgi:DNA-binding NtrC family response regulator